MNIRRMLATVVVVGSALGMLAELGRRIGSIGSGSFAAGQIAGTLVGGALGLRFLYHAIIGGPPNGPGSSTGSGGSSA